MCHYAVRDTAKGRNKIIKLSCGGKTLSSTMTRGQESVQVMPWKTIIDKSRYFSLHYRLALLILKNKGNVLLTDAYPLENHLKWKKKNHIQKSQEKSGAHSAAMHNSLEPGSLINVSISSQGCQKWNVLPYLMPYVLKTEPLKVWKGGGFQNKKTCLKAQCVHFTRHIMWIYHC